MTRPVPEEKLLEVLTRKTVSWTCDAFAQPRVHVLEVIRRHCGTVDPTTDRVTFPPSVTERHAPTAAAETPAAAAPPDRGPGTPSSQTALAEVIADLEPFARHDDSRVKRSATKAIDAAKTLLGHVTAYDAASEARRAETAAREKALAEIRRLEQELKEARAAIRPQTKRTTNPRPEQLKPARLNPTKPNAKDVRAWARGQGITVPDKGPLSQAVVDGYLSAQQVTAGA